MRGRERDWGNAKRKRLSDWKREKQ